jgi:hypothetical protein
VEVVLSALTISRKEIVVSAVLTFGVILTAKKDAKNVKSRVCCAFRLL